MSDYTQIGRATTCFGVGCAVHHRCARYLAVDGQRDSDRVATCVTPQGTFPHFTGFDGQPGGELSGHGRSAGAAVAAHHTTATESTVPSVAPRQAAPPQRPAFIPVQTGVDLGGDFSRVGATGINTRARSWTRE